MAKTQRNFQGPKPSYGVGQHSATIKHAQSNFDGGRTTKKAGNSRSAQINFDTKMSINVRDEPGQGQKSHTGNNDGY